MAAPASIGLKMPTAASGMLNVLHTKASNTFCRMADSVKRLRRRAGEGAQIAAHQRDAGAPIATSVPTHSRTRGLTLAASVVA